MTKAPDLLIRFKKKRNGTHSLTCVRADGSVTGQRGDGGFFIPHDLTHYAIETTFGLRRAFYGMLAGGWEFTDFGTPWPRGPFPQEAVADLALAEMLAGDFDAERYGQYPVTVSEFNARYAEACQQAGVAPKRCLTEADLDRVRARYAELMTLWTELPDGGTLELPFPATNGLLGSE
jgi:hypothetical protein